MKTSLTKNSRSASAFTMIEIAISIGVIGFALIAVIGILPRGMNAQKDNKEDTIISQDAPYFLNAIRNGEMRTNGGILANYVESIIVSNLTTPANSITYCNPFFTNGPNAILTSDMNILGILCTPEFENRAGFAGITNQVIATVRAMSGSAEQQNGANALTAFRYQLIVENAPWNFDTGINRYNPLYNAGLQAPIQATATAYTNFLTSMLHEVRLKFSWPLYPTGKIGEGRQTYRTFVSSHLLITNPPLVGFDLFFFEPNTYTNNTTVN